MKVLIVDDNEVSRMVLQKNLEKENYEPVSAENGIQALEILKNQNIRIVMTDWMMPEMDGLTLCKKIRQLYKKNYIFIIFITAKDHTKDIVEAMGAGADDFVTKPYDALEVMARLRAGNRIIQLEDDQKKISAQLLQSEKMASIGQLAAGVAHEINNPTGFVSSNLKTLSDYHTDIIAYLKSANELFRDLGPLKGKLDKSVLKAIDKIDSLKKELDIDYILDDIVELIKDCREGTERIKQIIIDLKDFAHPGEETKKASDINKGIDSTLNVISNEIKYKAEVKKNFAHLPLVYCYPQQLNQVFMNIIVNAAHAIETSGEISILTREENGLVTIKIKDNGKGIEEKHISQIFDPFFTTKEVGKGTGLGMHVAYNIIQKHNGTIDVKSKVGQGTEFTIKIPVGTDTDENLK